MAVTITATSLQSIVGIETIEESERLLPVASALVLRYAPDAPDALHDEAVIRCAGWLYGRPGMAASVRSEEAGPVSASYATSEKAALRHSGAMALLTTWKTRHAGAI